MIPMSLFFFAMDHLPSSVRVAAKKWYSFLVGFFALVLCFREGAVYLFFEMLVAYAMMAGLRGFARPLCVFLFTLGFLSAFHIYS